VRHGVAGGVLRDDLGGVGGGLARAAEVALAGAGPGDDLALGSVIETMVLLKEASDVGDAGGDVLRALGLADLDRAQLLLEEILGGGLLGDAADHLDGLGRTGLGAAALRPALLGPRARAFGAALRRRLQPWAFFSAGVAAARRAAAAARLLGRLFLLGSGLFFGHGGRCGIKRFFGFL
jgi:hypothetical protein